MKIIFRILLFLLIFITGFIALAVYHTFYKPLPDYTAQIKTQIMTQQVDVHWDPYGTPHIYAQNDADLFRAAGYVHAQDRLWQLTFFQILMEGRFAEFFGKELVEMDRHQRTIGLWRTAQKLEAAAPDTVIQKLQWYADGINTFIEQNRKNLPPEYSLLDIKPMEWTPAHSFGVARLLAWDQNMHWMNEMAYAYLYETVDQSVMRELLPYYDDSRPTSLDDLETRRIAEAAFEFYETQQKLWKLLSMEGSNRGSNAWAVSGSNTESGRPLLAGDPHMGISIPGFWYELHYSSPSYRISGATIPGAPFVVLGQNQNIAWSITNSMADDTDFYIEIVSSDNPDQYVADSINGEAVYRDFVWQEEIIKIKGEDDKLLRIPHTRNGPVISGLEAQQDLTGTNLVTMRWAGYEKSHDFVALEKLNRAKNLDQFREGLQYMGSPVMSYTYADRENNIALFTAGNLPIRDHNPVAFRKGWDPGYDWQGWIPFDELPHVINPDRGYLATANNKLHTDNYPHYIGTFWAPPSRMERIVQMLEANQEADLRYMQQMQVDVFSPHAEEVIEVILPEIRRSQEGDEFETALSYLENWDFNYSLSSTAASIFEHFFRTFSRNLLLQYMDETAYNRMIINQQNPVIVVTNMLNNSTSLLNIATEEGEEMRHELYRMSMMETLEALTEQYGPEPFEWRWEVLHTLTLRPPLLGEAARDPEAPAILKLIVNNLFNEGPFPVTGNALTINNTEYSWHNPHEMTLGPSIRRIIDFSTPHRAQSVLPTGQSGNPFSAHYGDQTELYLEGGYRYIYSDSTFFRESNYRTMRLF